nr:hypothetical protein [Tanacetum cinerariifolium]
SLSPSSLSDRSQPSCEYHAVPPPIWSAITATERDNLLRNVEEEPANFAFMAILSSSSTSDNEPIEASILVATPKPTSSKTNGNGKRKNRKTCFVCRSVDHLIKDCNFHAKPKTPPTPRNYAHKGYDKQLVSVVVPKILVTKPRHARLLITKSNSTIRRHKSRSQSSKTSNSSPKVTAAKA